MFQIEVAGLAIHIENRFENVRHLCHGYITRAEQRADIVVSVSDEEIKKEQEKEPGTVHNDGYTESVIVYEKISNALAAFDAFVMHSAVVEVNGKAYAFAAESGMGKTTHIRYWKEVLGDRVKVINGDKPIFRFISKIDYLLTDSKPSSGMSDNEKTLYAFGTPWCGKEGWQENTYAPLKALCLLERGEKNEIFPEDPFVYLGELMKHFHLPGEGLVYMPKLIGLIDCMISTIPVYRLRCTNDRSAAEMVISYFEL